MKIGNTLQRIFSRTVALSLPLAAVLASQSAKADYLWTGGASADWTAGWGTGSGWYCLKNLTAAPTVLFSSEVDASADSGVLVEGTVNYPVVFSATSPNGLAAKILGIGTGTYGEATLNGGTYTLSDQIAVPYDNWGNNAKGKLTIETGTAITTPNLRIGGTVKNTGANGEVVMNGGEITLSDAINLCNQNNGTAVFTMNGGTATAKYFVAGNKASANATATIAGGSVTVTDELRVASGNPSTGTVTVSGDGTRIAPKNVTIGYGTNGSGTINMNGGTFAASGYLRIAEADTTTGKFIQTAGNTSVAGYLCVGSQSKTSAYNGLFQLDGGTVTNTGTAMIIGAKGGANSVAKAVVNDGELVAKQIWVAEYSAGSNELEINGGSVAVSGDFYIARESGSNGKLTLNGGTLQTTGIKTVATAAIDFNGGTITDAGSGSHTLVTAATTAKILSGGAKFAIPGGAEATILASLATGVTEEGETDGGIEKTGGGALVLASGNTFTGPVKVTEGLLVVPAGESLNALTIGAKGAIAVDITDKFTTGAESIDLFTVSSLAFEEAGDSIDKVVFLKGPAVDYTVSYDSAGGKVTATITSETNASSTRTVKTFAPESSSHEWSDQTAAYSDRTLPGTYTTVSYDTVVVIGDRKMQIYNGDRHYNFQTYAVRGGTFWMVDGKSGVYPIIKASRLAGLGTVKLSQVGLNASNSQTVTVEEGVSVECSTESAPNGSAQDVWFVKATVDGNVVATNGVLKVDTDTVLNGKVTIGSYVTASFLNTAATLNGTLELLEGGTFNLNNKVLTLGPDAKLVLAGGKLTNTSASTLNWAEVEVADGSVAYADMTAHSATAYTVSGGQVVVTASSANVDLSLTPVTVKGGNVVLNVSGLTLSENDKVTLTGVTFGDGVSAADAIVVSGAAFDWTASVGENGTVTLSAATASGDNEWIGGASGNWKDAVNWKYGVPTAEQTVVFDTDATVTLDGSKTVERLVVDSTVKLQKSADKVYPQIYLKSAGGTGTIKLNRIGLYSNTDTSTICEIGHGENDDLTIEIEANGTADSWFEGAASGKGPIAIYAKVTGSGYLNLRRTVHLWGDMSEFSGVVTQVKDNNVTTKIYFGSAAASSANATWNLTGDVYLGLSHSDAKFTGSDADFTGTLKFGTLNTSNTATMKVNASVQNVVLEVGAGTWGNSYFLVGQSFSTGSNNDVVTKDVTLKKVGSGTLAYNGFGIPKIVVAEGVFSLGTPNTSLNHYSHTYTTIDSLTVAADAVLTGAGTRTVTNTTLASGAILRQAIAASGETYTCSTLTIDGTVDVTGVVGDLVDADNFLASAAATTEDLPTFTLLKATSVTGKPTGTVEMATSGWGWQAKVRESNTKLVMIPGPTVPGFIFIVR